MPFAGPAAAVLARSAVIAILLMVMSGGANSQSDGQGAGASGGAEEQQPVQEPGAAGAGAEPQEEAQEPGEPGADEEPQEEAQEPGEPGAVAEPQAIQDPDAGRFVMRILSGGSPNELVVPSVVSTSPERKEFKASAAQAADMFWACYEDQLKTMPAPLAQVDRLEPEAA